MNDKRCRALIKMPESLEGQSDYAYCLKPGVINMPPTGWLCEQHAKILRDKRREYFKKIRLDNIE